MKMYLISDNIDTQIGMRLVGIDGCVAHDSETITAEIKKAVNDPEPSPPLEGRCQRRRGGSLARFTKG